MLRTKTQTARVRLLARTKRALREEHGITSLSDWSILHAPTPRIELWGPDGDMRAVVLTLQSMGWSGYTEPSPEPGRRCIKAVFYGI